ncbi:MAG: hypothetical protein ABWZ88_12565 [Variovorax sp.]
MTSHLHNLHDWKSYLAEARRTGRNAVEMALMRAEARAFLERRDECGAIVDEYIGMIHPGIVGVFLFKMVPTRENTGEWGWVIVGGLPPAYINLKSPASAAEALDIYIGAMLKWLDLVERGAASGRFEAVNVRMTHEALARLKAGLHYLDHKILARYTAQLNPA